MDISRYINMHSKIVSPLGHLVGALSLLLYKHGDKIELST